MPLHSFRIVDIQIESGNRVVPTANERNLNPKNQMPSPDWIELVRVTNRIGLLRVTSRLTLFCLTGLQTHGV
jgi:ABC-type uncharacterized transport system involved in gliding motility auxiliary subunit